MHDLCSDIPDKIKEREKQLKELEGPKKILHYYHPKNASVLGTVNVNFNEGRLIKPDQFTNLTPCESCEFSCKCMDELIKTLIDLKEEYANAGIEINVNYIRCKDFSRKEKK